MIKEYVKSDKEIDWINYIIESLAGSSDLSMHMTEEYIREGFNEDTLTQAIDEVIYMCDDCGWWVEVCETNENGVCEDCQDV